MTLDEVKHHLRVDYDEDDVYIVNLIEVSDIYIESCVGEAYKENDKAKANDLLKSTLSNIDKCASKGLMKKNTCDRQKARLNKKVKEMN